MNEMNILKDYYLRKMENYKTAISCDAGNIQINETHIKYEIHAVHKYVGIFQRLLSLN